MRSCIDKESLAVEQLEDLAASLYLILFAYTLSPHYFFLPEVLQKLEIYMQNSSKTFSPAFSSEA